eukprot:PhM_4_TR3044/c3_g1_i1/m.45529
MHAVRRRDTLVRRPHFLEARLVRVYTHDDVVHRLGDVVLALHVDPQRARAQPLLHLLDLLAVQRRAEHAHLQAARARHADLRIHIRDKLQVVGAKTVGLVEDHEAALREDELALVHEGLQLARRAHNDVAQTLPELTEDIPCVAATDNRTCVYFGVLEVPRKLSQLLHDLVRELNRRLHNDAQRKTRLSHRHAAVLELRRERLLLGALCVREDLVAAADDSADGVERVAEQALHAGVLHVEGRVKRTEPRRRDEGLPQVLPVLAVGDGARVRIEAARDDVPFAVEVAVVVKLVVRALLTFSTVAEAAVVRAEVERCLQRRPPDSHDAGVGRARVLDDNLVVPLALRDAEGTAAPRPAECVARLHHHLILGQLHTGHAVIGV